MPKVTVHGHRPACLSASQVLNTVAQPPAENPSQQTEASAGLDTTQAHVKTINLGLIKLKVQSSPTEVTLREQAKKLQDKAIPYPSKHGFLGVELNGQVMVKPRESSVLGSEPVLCRHLATLFAAHAGKKSAVMQAFSTEEGIAEIFDGQLTGIHDASRRPWRNAPSGCKHLVNSEQFGSYLKAIAMRLQVRGFRRGPSQANCLLVTADHAMALHVEKKRKNRVSYFAVKLYDPNDTAIYRRVVMANPEDFGDLKLKDMMISPQLISFYARGENKPLSMAAVSLDDRLQPLVDRSAVAPLADNMHLALKCGLLDEVHLMLKFALDGSQPPDERMALLRASSLENGRTVPGLFKAFAFGQSDAIKAFSEAVLAAKDLPEQDKVDLLAANTSEGDTGLFMALQNGHFDSVKAFLAAVLASSLSQEAKDSLLLGVNGIS